MWNHSLSLLARARQRATLAALVPVLALACNRQAPAPPVAPWSPRAEQRARHRVRQAAVTIRFSNGSLQPGAAESATDRLQVAAVFGDIDRRDMGVFAGLVGQTPQEIIPALDSCVRQARLYHQLGDVPASPPAAYMQLLDVGNVQLHAAANELPLRVRMVPSLFDAVRGVRYDADLDMGRPWLAAGSLHVTATGGDGVAAFDAEVPVPRPVRLTHVGREVVRNGRVQGPQVLSDLSLRWGSVDGTAELELQLGTEQVGALGWLRCRVRDDGEFVIPAAFIEQLPTRSPSVTWLALLARTRRAAVPGFEDKPLRLEVTDSAYVQ